MPEIQLAAEDLDRVYFYVCYKLINPDHHKMLDYADSQKRVDWEVEDGAKDKYAKPRWEIQGRRLEVRIHLPSSEVKITEDGKDFRYCPEDVLNRCEDALRKEGYEVIEQ